MAPPSLPHYNFASPWTIS